MIPQIAPTVGLLGVNDRHLWPKRGYRHQLLPGERAFYGLYRRRHLRQIGADVAAKDGEGEVRGPGDVAVGHAGVGVLVYLQGSRPAVLDGVAEAVEAPDARVAAPGEDQLASRAHPDHLVVDEVRRHPDEGKVPLLLADDLVRSGERDEVREALEGDRVPVIY